MLWPKNSFGVVTWPCALAVAVAATKARGSIAARQVRNLRIDIQNLRKVGKARSELRLASGNTRQKRRLLSARQSPDTLQQLREIVRARSASARAARLRRSPPCARKCAHRSIAIVRPGTSFSRRLGLP